MEAFALQQAVFFHKIINFLLILIIAFKLVVSIAVKESAAYQKLIWYATPIYVGFLAISLFSVISILAIMQFKGGFMYIIAATNIIIIASEIQRNKMAKTSHKSIITYSIISHAMCLALLCANMLCYP